MPDQRRDDPVELSSDACARKEEILEQLQVEAPRAAIRRSRRRRVVASTLSLAVVATLIALWPGGASNAPPTAPIAAAPAPATPKLDIAMVPTDSGIAERLRLDVSRHPDVEIIDDAELVRTLTALGRPAGVARMGSQAILTTNVADARIGEDSESETSAG
jgi:hypothetical protein